MAALAIIGTLAQGVAGFAAAQQNKAIADYNVQVAQRNASVARNEAESAASEKRRENARVLGTMRAAYGSSGLTLSGSPLDVLEDTATEQELDVAKIRYKGMVKATAYADEANNYRMKGDLAEMEGTSSLISGATNAITKTFAMTNAASQAGTSLLMS